MADLQSTDAAQGLALPWWPWFAWTQRLAPEVLTQPINPGWSFGNIVSINNSSAPETERAIVDRHSYGRQLGRMMDVIDLLLDERKPARPDQRIDEYRELRAQIDAIKLAAARRRLEGFSDDLRALKRDDKPAFERMRAELRRIIDDER